MYVCYLNNNQFLSSFKMNIFAGMINLKHTSNIDEAMQIAEEEKECFINKFPFKCLLIKIKI